MKAEKNSWAVSLKQVRLEPEHANLDESSSHFFLIEWSSVTVSFAYIFSGVNMISNHDIIVHRGGKNSLITSDMSRYLHKIF